MNFAELFGRPVGHQTRDWIVNGTFDGVVNLVNGDVWNLISNEVADELWELVTSSVCYSIGNELENAEVTREFH